MPHEQKLFEVIIPKVNAYQSKFHLIINFRPYFKFSIISEYVKIFDSIGMLDLFENYMHTVSVCGIETVGIIASNLAHVDQQEGLDCATGLTNNLSYPLSCASNILDMDINTLKFAYGEVLQKCLIWRRHWKLVTDDDFLDNFTWLFWFLRKGIQ